MVDFNINRENKSTRNLKLKTDGVDLSQLIKGPTKITISTRTQMRLVFSNRPE